MKSMFDIKVLHQSENKMFKFSDVEEPAEKSFKFSTTIL